MKALLHIFLTALIGLSFGLMGKTAYAGEMDLKELEMNEPEITTYWPAVMTAFLGKPDGRGMISVDYQALVDSKLGLQSLDIYITYLERLNPDNMDRDAALAYWANLYNALTVKVITENYPLRSIKKIKNKSYPRGPWKTDVSTVNGEALSLDDIEHKRMRKNFPTPMIHYMVNCASVSCPNLKSGEWLAEILEDDLDAAARAYVNSPRGVQVTQKGLKLSKIYKWYRKDFGGSKDAVLKHIRQYADDDLAGAIDGGAKIIGYDYDWDLNDVTNTE